MSSFFQFDIELAKGRHISFLCLFTAETELLALAPLASALV